LLLFFESSQITTIRVEREVKQQQQQVEREIKRKGKKGFVDQPKKVLI